MIFKTSTEKSLEQLKYIDRLSRQTRHHRTHLNQVCEQKLQEKLTHLTFEFEQTFIRLKTSQKLEQQRKQVLGITIQQIAHERQRHSLSTNIKENGTKSHIKQLRTSLFYF